MTDMMELDLYDAATSGFRLQRLEIYNWGTFHDCVWSLDLDGDNALVTGNIGSGKSTLVDAITTLLVPPNKVSYNKAAGAEHKERTVASYVHGHFKSERNEATGTAKPVALRGSGSYSVLLARFFNMALRQTVTLAQVFWFSDRSGNPARLYAVCEQPLTIADDFSNVGADLGNLRRHLREREATLYDSFSKYAADFRRRMGIAHPQALDLFHQTVSMKSVGNLTEFVRTHMLEPPAVGDRITSLIEHFHDLTKAHDAVVEARRQVQALTPLVERLDQCEEAAGQAHDKRAVRESLTPYFTTRKVELLRARLERTSADRDALLSRRAGAEQDLRDIEREEQNLHTAIRDNGGERIMQLEADIADLTASRERKKVEHGQYVGLCEQVGVSAATDEQSLIDQQLTLGDLQETLSADKARLENDATERAVALRDAQGRLDEIEAELKGLADRSSNIDQNMVAIRTLLCQGVGLEATDIPFAGELLRVTDEQWEPAAERLLRGFALSLLVRDEHYSAVSEWVDRTNLHGRIVYFRVRDGVTVQSVTDPRSLVHKLEVRPGTAFSGWLTSEAHRRFDVVCAETAQEFRAERRAITVNGQIKSGGERHEKDDRRALGDRRWYVLGWDNSGKRKALEQQRGQASTLVQTWLGQQHEVRAAIHGLDVRSQQVFALLQPRSWSTLDWRADATRVQTLTEHLNTLREADDTLRQLNHRLLNVQEQKVAKREQFSALDQRLGDLNGKIARDEALTAELLLLPAATAEQFEAVAGLEPEGLRVETCDSSERTLRLQLQADIDRLDERFKRLSSAIVAGMGDFRNEWPLVAAEMDADVAAGHEYRGLLQRLLDDDLPRFEEKFKLALNTQAIREVVGFRTALETAREDIRRRVGDINRSLRDIPYQPHTYIRLEPTPTTDADVRDFRAQLTACTEDTVTGSGDNQYSEAKFLQVKEIVSRLQGREGRAEQDKRWTAKVTDVRNWFTFAASERRTDDDSEHEHYTDSGGKSGGQKEKLAYTILAASLAYQFGLVGGHSQTRTFRFVVIDEAFGRGSDDSAQFGLELFKRLDLQLLVVTPLQKIHIIEPYVAHVGFVHTEGGTTSKLRTLTMSEYRDGRARHEL